MTDAGLSVIAVAPDDPAVLAAWDRLAGVGAVRTPFESPEWWRALCETDPLDGELLLLVAHDRAGQVLGLLGLERARRQRLRALVAPGARWLAPDHLDVVATPDNTGRVADAIGRHLAGDDGWDLLYLESLRSARLTRALARGLALPLPPAEPVMLPYVDLRGGAGALPWSRGLRQQIGRGLRAAERAGGGVVAAVRPDDVHDALDILMRLHNQRFGSTSAVFATAARRRFHHVAARRLADRGVAHVLRLRVGSTDGALLYGFDVGDVSYYYALGIDPGVGGSPGRTLLGAAILRACEQRRREYDLLRGEHRFKLRFASGVRQEPSLRRLRANPAGARFAAGALLHRVARQH